MKILSIGNSFSVDAHTYLYKLATNLGAEIESLNLFIGGCSLERHHKCLTLGLADYEPQYNGTLLAGAKISVQAAVNMRDWDIITVQQVSHLSGIYESYQPYLNALVDYVRSVRPNAKIFVHETWAYEYDSTHEKFINYGKDRFKMHAALADAYAKAAEEIHADGIIPSGDVISALRELPEFHAEIGGISLSRDGFHLSYDYGRYAAAAAFVQALGIGDVKNSSFLPTADSSPALIKIINDKVFEICK